MTPFILLAVTKTLISVMLPLGSWKRSRLSTCSNDATSVSCTSLDIHGEVCGDQLIHVVSFIDREYHKNFPHIEKKMIHYEEAIADGCDL